MAICSYRIQCEKCEEDTVLKEDTIDDSPWKVKTLHYHKGICPDCNPMVDLEDTDWSPEPEELELEGLDGIGAKAAQNLREAGYDTEKKIVEASDEELLDVSWIGDKGLFSLKEATKQHDPQQRWDK